MAGEKSLLLTGVWSLVLVRDGFIVCSSQSSGTPWLIAAGKSVPGERTKTNDRGNIECRTPGERPALARLAHLGGYNCELEICWVIASKTVGRSRAKRW